MVEKITIEDRVKNYWDQRVEDFSKVRTNELNSDLSNRWISEITKHIPNLNSLNILDVGTGTGYFPIILSNNNNKIYGIDISPAMIEKAKLMASSRNLKIEFMEMDAQKLTFNNNTFDLIISRNLTWTLPKLTEAYKEWLRVLKPGGIILIFDANYCEQVKLGSKQNPNANENSPYGHAGLTEKMLKENEELTLIMPASKVKRPMWDEEIFYELGASKVEYDLELGKRVLKELDLVEAPMFMIKVITKD